MQKATIDVLAKASEVAGVQTGNEISAASEKSSLEATIWNLAVPAYLVSTGKKSATRLAAPIFNL